MSDIHTGDLGAVQDSDSVPSGDSVTLIETIRSVLQEAVDREFTDEDHSPLFALPALEALRVLELRESDRQSSESRGLEASKARRVEVEEMEDWFRELHDSIDVLGDCEGGERRRMRVAMRAAETIEVNYWQLLASTAAALPPPGSGSSGLGSASALEVGESAWDHCRDWLLRQLTNCTDDADTLAEATGLALARAHARDLHDAVGVIASATKPEASPSPENKGLGRRAKLVVRR